MMRRLFQLIAMAACVLLCDAAIHAQLTPTVAAPIIYRLAPNATLQRGCFTPCLCPVLFQGQVRGTMVLSPTVSGSNTVFDYTVSEVNWLAQAGNQEWRITGSGILHRVGAPAIGAQRLELDLQIGSERPQHYDSGWVASSASFPAIDLTISVNGGVCFDTVIRVSAAPAPNSQLLRYRILAGSQCITGCFPPCTCPLTTRPLSGSFTLVPIPSLNSTPGAVIGNEYAVVSARLATMGPATSPLNVAQTTYRGCGFYRRNLPGLTPPSTRSQRMFLDLRTSNAAALQRFDSGVVATPATFPIIDISLSKNNMVCLDTVFDFVAAPLATTP